MKNIYLFPNKLKIPALVLFLFSCIAMLLEAAEIYTLPELKTSVFAVVSDKGNLFNPSAEYSSIITNSITDEIIECMFFISGIVLAFSKEKIEDELITFIRFKSLVYATYFTILLLVLSEIFIYGWAFLSFLMIYFYSFILFLNIFYYTKLFIYKKQFSYENED
ncbi:hypothetical protein [Paenimyroides aestuarii]|uniref:Uncharacterized protein n=1 Tax=Paenimyroides aestuarii TaxID=2968490 RepID=A0ABY5NTY2_9FLAO|nr:hypothetical protein [Paenimyroides aestuarii]UUV21917.1 hypothetical protein NPX36_02420 [Paenimyroides aestuarii]